MAPQRTIDSNQWSTRLVWYNRHPILILGVLKTLCLFFYRNGSPECFITTHYSMLYSWPAVWFVVGCEISISAETNNDCIHDIGIEVLFLKEVTVNLVVFCCWKHVNITSATEVNLVFSVVENMSILMLHNSITPFTKVYIFGAQINLQNYS
jgi:hypothetical protein